MVLVTLMEVPDVEVGTAMEAVGHVKPSRNSYRVTRKQKRGYGFMAELRGLAFGSAEMAPTRLTDGCKCSAL